MPCESCHVQFTVFRRKRTCIDCKRFFCNSCLSTSKRNSQLCGRCIIFAKRPLLRQDLQQLKPKDLIFYLQSKHISTAGCVEKEELIHLVLNHIEQVDRERAARSASNRSSSTSPDDKSDFNGSPFEGIKQSCQNFFTTITDNISDSLASFDTKNTATSKNAHAQSPQDANGAGETRSNDNNNVRTHIFEQPRVATREIPRYSSFNTNESPAIIPTTSYETPDTTATQSPSSNSNGQAIPITDQVGAFRNQQGNRVNRNKFQNEHASDSAFVPGRVKNAQVDNGSESYIDTKSECECSDDEIFITFSEQISSRTNINESNPNKLVEPSSSVSRSASATTTTTTASTDQQAKFLQFKSPKLSVGDLDESLGSSFEELGAVGGGVGANTVSGISDESKATTSANSGSLEQWQILESLHYEAQRPAEDLEHNKSMEEPSTSRQIKESRRLFDSYAQASDNTNEEVVRTAFAEELNMHCSSDDQLQAQTHPQPQPQTGSRMAGHCLRCGKSRKNLQRHVERMRRHLENSQMSDEVIKKELEDFLAYLENRTTSIDSDTETGISSPNSAVNASTPLPVTSACSAMLAANQPSVASPDYHEFDLNEGIYVYAGDSDADDYVGPSKYVDANSRFVDLHSYENLEELESLTVKQLKEVLMLHRVDYKGCCEKRELFERVERLWKTLKAAPAVDKLQTDEVCKICMDAPIECVILECGHMATCTNCGKVLSECPICRQYIVRVVRCFRA